MRDKAKLPLRGHQNRFRIPSIDIASQYGRTTLRRAAVAAPFADFAAAFAFFSGETRFFTEVLLRCPD